MEIKGIGEKLAKKIEGFLKEKKLLVNLQLS